jgi:ankyrin repeat protein
MADQETLDERLVRESEKGHTEAVKALLDASADVHAGGDLALRAAQQKGHAETVKVLKAAMAASPARPTAAA